MDNINDITKMNLYNLREYISNLEFRRDKLGHSTDVIKRLDEAQTELVRRQFN